MPTWLQIFVTQKCLEQLVEKWFQGVKNLLDDGKVNGSQDEEKNKSSKAAERSPQTVDERS